MSDRRTYSRIIYPTEATLSLDDMVWDTCLLDISLTGALVDTPDDWQKPDHGPLILRFKPPKSKETIQLEVHVVHDRRGYLGLARDRSKDDNEQKLEHLIADHLGEEALLRRDLAHMLPDDDDHEFSASIVRNPDEPDEWLPGELKD